MHDLDLVLNFFRQQKLVSVVLGRSENDCLSLSTITDQNIGKSRDSVMPWNIYGEMLHRL